MKNKNLFYALLFALFATMNVACSKDDDDEIIKDNQENKDDNKDDNTDDTNDPNNKDEETSEFECLKGPDYYLFAMDGNTEQKISSKITLDCRPNQ